MGWCVWLPCLKGHEHFPTLFVSGSHHGCCNQLLKRKALALPLTSFHHALNFIIHQRYFIKNLQLFKNVYLPIIYLSIRNHPKYSGLKQQNHLAAESATQAGYSGNIFSLFHLVLAVVTQRLESSEGSHVLSLIRLLILFNRSESDSPYSRKGESDATFRWSKCL